MSKMCFTERCCNIEFSFRYGYHANDIFTLFNKKVKSSIGVLIYSKTTNIEKNISFYQDPPFTFDRSSCYDP